MSLTQSKMLCFWVLFSDLHSIMECTSNRLFPNIKGLYMKIRIWIFYNLIIFILKVFVAKM